jgi:hypothetical protein
MQHSGERRIYCDEVIAAACLEIGANYNGRIGDVADAVRSAEAGRPSRDAYFGLMGEFWMLDMMAWLRDRKGWTIDYPITREVSPAGYRVLPIQPGKRVQVDYPSGDSITEFDMVASFFGSPAIGEAKSGSNSFETGHAFKKVGTLKVALGWDAGFILAVPMDHEILRDGRKGRFEMQGGRILVFGADSAQLHETARDIYRESRLAGKVGERDRSHARRSWRIY